MAQSPDWKQNWREIRKKNAEDARIKQREEAKKKHWKCIDGIQLCHDGYQSCGAFIKL